MKVAFVSNFYNHHQSSLCGALWRDLGDDFSFIETEPVPAERLALGYQNLTSSAPFVVSRHASESARQRADRLIADADWLIFGSAPMSILDDRAARNAPTLVYSERLFKQGAWRMLDPRVAASLYTHHSRRRRTSTFLLAAGAYAARDFRMIGAYPNKIYKWGYFPQPIRLRRNPPTPVTATQKPLLLWVGRLLDWKRPYLALRAAVHLRSLNIDFTMEIIGTGPQEPLLRRQINELHIDDSVFLVGSLPFDEVRQRMLEADLLLFTSNRQEGWGAVVNEGMSAGCVVVASDATGAATYLIEHGRTGLLFRSGRPDELDHVTSGVLGDRQLADRMRSQAVEQMLGLWSPDTAASRLLQLAQGHSDGRAIRFESGPCSPAF